MFAMLEESDDLKNEVHFLRSEIFANIQDILQAGCCKVCKHDVWFKTSKSRYPETTQSPIVQEINNFHACGMQTTCQIECKTRGSWSCISCRARWCHCTRLSTFCVLQAKVWISCNMNREAHSPYAGHMQGLLVRTSPAPAKALRAAEE